MINENKKSTTVKSYISATKAVLLPINIEVKEDTCLLNSLTRACKLTKDKVTVRLPIQKDMLEVILQTTRIHFEGAGQEYLYTSLFVTAYYGLFRVGKLTMSRHAVKACNVHIGSNKNKLLFVLCSLKTLSEGDPPQLIKITNIGKSKKTHNCPFKLLRAYLDYRWGYLDESENFFFFYDRTPVRPANFSSTLKTMLKLEGFDEQKYTTHSLISGRSMDLMKYGISVETIKKLGRWRSNAVYAYLK